MQSALLLRQKFPLRPQWFESAAVWKEKPSDRHLDELALSIVALNRANWMRFVYVREGRTYSCTDMSSVEFITTWRFDGFVLYSFLCFFAYHFFFLISFFFYFAVILIYSFVLFMEFLSFVCPFSGSLSFFFVFLNNISSSFLIYFSRFLLLLLIIVSFIFSISFSHFLFFFLVPYVYASFLFFHLLLF